MERKENRKLDIQSIQTCVNKGIKLSTLVLSFFFIEDNVMIFVSVSLSLSLVHSIVFDLITEVCERVVL